MLIKHAAAVGIEGADAMTTKALEAALYDLTRPGTDAARASAYPAVCCVLQEVRQLVALPDAPAFYTLADAFRWLVARRALAVERQQQGRGGGGGDDGGWAERKARADGFCGTFSAFNVTKVAIMSPKCFMNQWDLQNISDV